MKRILLVLGAVLLVVALAVAAFYFALGAPPLIKRIPDKAMEPTLRVGERVVANPRVKPSAGSLVLYTAPDVDEMLAGRVIATGGQTIDLVGGRVIVDDKLLDEPYRQGQPTYPTSTAVTFPVKLQTGEVWILGDNRTTNADSRQFGPIPASSVKGAIALVYWPLTRFRVINLSR